MPAINGRRVRALREGLGFKQYELAIHADVSQGHLSQIERNRVESVGSIIVVGLARALSTNADYLIGESDDPRAPGREPLGALKPDEEALLRLFRAFSDDRSRQMLHEFAKIMAHADGSG